MKRAQKATPKPVATPSAGRSKGSKGKARKSATVSAAVRLIDRAFEYMAGAQTDGDRRCREGAAERIVTAVLNPIAEREFQATSAAPDSPASYDPDPQPSPGDPLAPPPPPAVRNVTSAIRSREAIRAHERSMLESQWANLNGRTPQG